MTNEERLEIIKDCLDKIDDDVNSLYIYKQKKYVLDVLKEQNASIGRYKQALEYYASRTEWCEGDIYLDGGRIARKALEGDNP